MIWPSPETATLQRSLRAWEGANEVCRRDWDRPISSRVLMIDLNKACL
jgi:hypothetical protein